MCIYFNSRPCVRGDPAETKYTKDDYLFQFTPLREGRPSGHSEKGALPYFNSRPCVRGDVYRLQGFWRHIYFNSRPCVRGDLGLLQAI